MRFNVLGPLEVVDDGQVRAANPPKLRTVLALLLLHPNEPVSTAALTEELWWQSQPRSAVGTLQTYIYQLRKLLRDGRQEGPGELLVTRSPGYELRVRPDQVDVYRFDQLAAEGGRALAAGEAESASALLRQALSLWRGPALADVTAGPQLQAHIARLEERRLSLLEQRIEADLACGRDRELIGELKELTAVYRFHERLYLALMVALGRSGRRSEALDVYHVLRRVLQEELGLEPTGELQRMQRAILCGALPQR